MLEKLFDFVFTTLLSCRSPWRSGIEHIFEKYERQHLSGAGSSPAGSISQDLNSQKLHY